MRLFIRLFVPYNSSYIMTYETIVQWNFSKPASTETEKYGQFRGVAGFVRFLCKELFGKDLKSADILGGPVFWGSGLEIEFHCITNCYKGGGGRGGGVL
jgi:hypothetical protein